MANIKNKLLILLIFMIPLFCFGQKFNTNNTIIKLDGKFSQIQETTKIIIKKRKIIFKKNKRKKMVFVLKQLFEMYSDMNVVVKSYFTNKKGIIISVVKKQGVIIGVRIINVTIR
tara:strand:+ start:1833 stop:2177 length:345 start_codon:yes stop_codon:yes gene_type:complete